MCRFEVSRSAWELPFLAEARELSGLRRVMRLHLTRWGLPRLVDAAQLCVSELVGNVIRHVGPGTPATLSVSMKGMCLRIEVQDPDAQALPTLLSPQGDEEAGRGLALVDTTASRWGVVLRGDSKVVWCELEAGLVSPHGHMNSLSVTRAEALLTFYGTVRHTAKSQGDRLSAAIAEESAVEVIADLLQWLRAHGSDADEAVDRAQMRCEAEMGEAGDVL
ncbi:ATP-binding protein [Streptomyces jumonjinensis]|uniref:ATP-binding protein n=1 Tax=Streptomyces jumonjinensis TaxID=1945 RepID=UPI00378FC25A